MCSVIGYKGKFQPELVKKLLYNSRIRGLHAFGYSFYLNKELTTRKFLDYKSFEQSICEEKPDLFIAHFRYSTSGDYKVIDNNQPLQQNNVCIAFNGVISQKTKEEIEEEYKVVLKNDNDGYLLIQKLNDVDFLSKKNISFALVGLQLDRLFFMRNEKRPLHLFESDDLKVVASTKDILERSGIEKSVLLKSNQFYFYD